MSVEDTLQFLHTRSGARPTARPFAGQLAGDVVVAPHYRYPAGRARVPWFDTYGGGGRKTGLDVVDAIKQRRSGYSGTVIRTKRGTVVQTRGSAVAGKSHADMIRLAATKGGSRRTGWTPTIPTKLKGVRPDTRGGDCWWESPPPYGILCCPLDRPPWKTCQMR